MPGLHVLRWADHRDGFTGFTGFRSSMAVWGGPGSAGALSPGRGIGLEGCGEGAGAGCDRLEEGYIASSTGGLAAALGSRTQQG